MSAVLDYVKGLREAVTIYRNQLACYERGEFDDIASSALFSVRNTLRKIGASYDDITVEITLMDGVAVLEALSFATLADEWTAVITKEIPRSDTDGYKSLAETREMIAARLIDLGRLYERANKKGGGKGKYKKKREPSFDDVIQYPDKEKLKKRLHELIDGKSGADVGCVLLNAKLAGYLTRNPTQSEYLSEFKLMGVWSAIHNYMDESNENALDRQNKVVIFD